MALTVTSNGTYDDIPECPLCLEPFSLDDINFYPCSCRYQICRFCWHRIRTDENGLCPHCREMYSENPAEYTPPTADQLAKLKSEKKHKEQCKKQKVSENREKLASVRVIQRNLVFVIGLSPRLADPEVLKRNEYFGKFGKIYKVVINNHTIYSGAQGPSVSAYVTYCRNEDASKAIAAVNNATIDGRSLKASFGTTKYCTSFLKGTTCTKPDCMYLHELGDDEASFTKQDMQLGKHQVFEHATLASLLTGGVSGGGVVNHTNHKDHSVPDGSTKGKSLSSQRSREQVMPESVESALPASAHWAQKAHSSNDSSADQTHSHSKQSGSNVSGKAGNRTLPSGNSAQLHPTASEQNGPTKPKRIQRTQDATDVDDSSYNLRSESLSPNTQKQGHSRSSNRRITGNAGAGRDRDGGVGNRGHSRGSSLGTKSLTPNLSPRSTISASSSVGSLEANPVDESANVGAESRADGGNGRVPETVSESSKEEDIGQINKELHGRNKEPHSFEEMFSGETWEDDDDDDDNDDVHNAGEATVSGVTDQMAAVNMGLESGSRIEDKVERVCGNGDFVPGDRVCGRTLEELLPASNSLVNSRFKTAAIKEQTVTSQSSPPGLSRQQQHPQQQQLQWQGKQQEQEQQQLAVQQYLQQARLHQQQQMKLIQQQEQQHAQQQEKQLVQQRDQQYVQKQQHVHIQEQQHVHQQEQQHVHQQEQQHVHRQEQHVHRQEQQHMHQQEQKHVHRQEQQHVHRQEQQHRLQESSSQSTQPLTLSQQPERVCRKLEMGSGKSAELIEQEVGVTGQSLPSRQLPRVIGARDLSRNSGSAMASDDMHISAAVSSNTDVQSSTVSGNKNSSNLITSWSPHQPHPHPSNGPSASQSDSSRHPSSSVPNPSGYVPRPHVVPSGALPQQPSLPHMERTDDSDELGFDPCVVSQQGLADLLETEAEQKQQQHQSSYHPYQQYPQYGHFQQQHQQQRLPYSHHNHTHSSRQQSSNPTHSSFPFRKSFPNGITSHPEGDGKLQQKWQDGTSSSYSRLDSDPVGLSDVSSSSSSSMTSFKDEFRALFPTVNISFGESSSKSWLDSKSSSLGQALTESKNKTLSYLPSSSSSSSASSHYSNQYRSKQELSKNGALSSTTDFFLGQSQPGFPSTCLKVRDHSSSSSSIGSEGTNINNISSSGSVKGSEPVGLGSSVSSCLGPEWPGLGIALGSTSKLSNSTLTSADDEVSSVQLSSPKREAAPPGVESGRGQSNLKANFSTVEAKADCRVSQPPHGLVGESEQKPSIVSQLLYGGVRGVSDGSEGQPSSSSPLLAATGVTATSSISNLWQSQAPLSVSVAAGSNTTPTTAPSLPSPPPGFSKPANGDGVITGTAVPAGNGFGTSGMGNQSQISANIATASPAFMMTSKGQMIPNPQFAQAWANQIRSVSALTSEQLQVIARNNQVAYQHLVRRQMLFQQALMRNPQAMLQVQSLWMAQLQQQAMLFKQQQAMAAASVEVPAAGSNSLSENNVSLPGGMVAVNPLTTRTQTSKLLGTMSNSGLTTTTESVTVPSSKLMVRSPEPAAVPSTCKPKVSHSDGAAKLSSKPPRQNTGHISKAPSVPASSTKIASGGKSAGSARSSAQIANGPAGQQISNSSSKGDATRHLSKTSRNLTKGKVSGVSQNSSGDKRSRQKYSK